MHIIIDIIVVLILVCSVYRGYKKGIVDIGFKLIAFIASLLITLILYSPITDLVINNTGIDEMIEEVIIKNGVENKENNSIDNNGTESNTLDNFLGKYTKEVAKETQKTVVETTAKPIARNVVGIGIMIVLFLGSRVILGLLKTFTDIITKIPVIKQLNEFAGLAYGLLIGLIIIYVVLAIMFFITSISGNMDINDAINNTYITKYLYEENLLLKFMF